MARKKTINVAIVGCNTRALWYGAIFDDIDPEAYARIDPFNYHHLTVYQDTELRIEKAEGFRLVKVYDPDQGAAQIVADAFRSKPEVCATLDDASEKVDLVMVANASADGSDHRELATPGLNRGVPTFVDRPLAATVEDAKALISLARRKHAPLMSCSHMRLLPHAARFKSRFAELDPIDLGTVQGIGPDPALTADGIELAILLFGDEFGGQVKSVQSMGSWPLEVMHLSFEDPKTDRALPVLLQNSDTGTERRAFFAKAQGQRLPVDSPDFEAFRQVEGGRMVMEALREMVQTGKGLLTAKEMLEPIAVAEAGHQSHNRAQPVKLGTVR